MATIRERIRHVCRALAWAALTRLRRRATAASGQDVRFLVGFTNKTPGFSPHEALVLYFLQGGTYERYLEEGRFARRAVPSAG
eukprot:16434042-Heterocapsa_arctica.AAC.1